MVNSKYNGTKNAVKKGILTGVALLGLVNAAKAIPTLQLDVGGGIYVSGTEETVMAQGNPFTLYALFDTISGHGNPSGTYYISAAIVPKVGPSPGNFGSFQINGTTYSAGSGMQYGGPPVDSLYPDLPYHGIFNTFYAEIPFTFNLANKAASYNTQDNPGGPTLDSNGKLIFQAFNVDTSGLLGDYVVHFDLYDENVHQKKKIIDYSLSFAPFSHDAQSTQVHVPDGGMTLVLLGMSLAGITWLARRQQNCLN